MRRSSDFDYAQYWATRKRCAKCGGLTKASRRVTHDVLCSKCEQAGTKRKELVRGVDEDIKKAFFNLDVKEKQKIFLHYKREYGQEAREYAEKTYKKWKSGEVRMSGKVADRLLAILPYYLSFDEKFSLIQRIWQERTHSHIRIVVDVREDMTTIMKRILDAIDCVEVKVFQSRSGHD